MIGVDPSSDGLARAREAGRRGQRRRGGLAAGPGRAARPGVRGHLGQGPPGQRRPLRGGRDHRDRPDPGGRRPVRLPRGERRRARRRAEHQHDHLRRPGDHPDGARGLPGRPRCRTRRSSRPSRPARPARAPGRTSTSSPRPPRTPSRPSAGRQRGKAIIILNPVSPPMIMRDTVFCAIGAGRRPGRDHRVDPPDGRRGAAVRARLQLRSDPQFDDPNPAWHGNGRVAVFLEVRGNGDYLPAWAGNLDIMTAAAVRAGELIITGEGSGAAMSDRSTRATTTDDQAGRPADRQHPARRQPRRPAPVHRGPRRQDRRRAGRGRPAGHRGDPRRRPVRLDLQLRLRPAHRRRTGRAAAVQDREAGEDRRAGAAGPGHRGEPARGARCRRADRPGGHPLHRGRRVGRALRARPASWAWKPLAS